MTINSINKFDASFDVSELGPERKRGGLFERGPSEVEVTDHEAVVRDDANGANVGDFADFSPVSVGTQNPVEASNAPSRTMEGGEVAKSLPKDSVSSHQVPGLHEVSQEGGVCVGNSAAIPDQAIIRKQGGVEVPEDAEKITSWKWGDDLVKADIKIIRLFGICPSPRCCGRMHTDHMETAIFKGKRDAANGGSDEVGAKEGRVSSRRKEETDAPDALLVSLGAVKVPAHAPVRAGGSSSAMLLDSKDSDATLSSEPAQLSQLPVIFERSSVEGANADRFREML
jgi:hypothetical protein